MVHQEAHHEALARAAPVPHMMQELLLGGGEGDATRLPDAQLILDVEAELAPPPFEDLLLQ